MDSRQPPVQPSPISPQPPVEPVAPDLGSHYRRIFAAPLTQHDIDRKFIYVKLDPYRICDIYDVGGGPREHIIKKALRGTDKGHSERKLIDELQTCLDRWKEMIMEDEAREHL